MHHVVAFALFVFFGDPTSPFRFCLLPSASPELLCGLGIFVEVASLAGSGSTSMSAESSTGAREPTGMNRCLSNSFG